MVPNGTNWIIPNILSLVRIGLALIFPWSPPPWRPGLVVAAALSDLFDGRLSRALHGTSTVGQILDPVADKLFVASVLITLVISRQLTVAVILLLGFRDLTVLLGSIWSVIRDGWLSLHQMPPSLLGKLATAGQFGFLLLVALGIDRRYSFFRLAEVAAVTLSIVAGLDYLRRKSPSTANHETA